MNKQELIEGIVELSNDYQSAIKDIGIYQKQIQELQSTIKTLNRLNGEQQNDIEELKREVK